MSTTVRATPESPEAVAGEPRRADLEVLEGVQETLQECVTRVVQEEFRERMRVGVCPLVVDTVVARWKASRAPAPSGIVFETFRWFLALAETVTPRARELFSQCFKQSET